MNPAHRVKFGEWFSESWKLLTRDASTWFLISLTVLMSIMAVYFVLVLVAASAGIELGDKGLFKMPEVLGSSWSLVLIITFSVTIVQSLFVAGMFNTVFKQMRNEKVSLADLFTGYEHFINVVVAMLLINLIQFFVQSFLSMLVPFWWIAIVPGWIIQGLLFLTLPMVIKKGLSPLEAIVESFNTTKHDWLMFTAFALCVNIAIILGLLALCIGIVFLFPLLYISMAVAYRDLVEPGMQPMSAVDALYTKYCTACGNALPVNASFCDRCGASQV